MKLFDPGKIPSALVHVAALFASKDSTKPTINTVNIRRHGCRMIVEAADGHIAIQASYEAEVKTAEIPPMQLECGSIMLSAKPLTKGGPLAEANTFRIESPVLGVIEGVNGPLDYRSITIEQGVFPTLDQLWPDHFSNDLVLPVSLQPELVIRLCKAQVLLSKVYGALGGHWSTNKANQPIGVDAREFASFETIGVDNLRVRMLLMPMSGLHDGRPLYQRLNEISEDRQAEIQKMVDRGVTHELAKRSLKLSILEEVAA